MSVDPKPAMVSVPPLPLLCTPIVSYSKGFVKRFFTFFFLAFPSLCGGTSLPLDTLIVSYLG